MNYQFFLAQLLNGVQLGVLLFLMAAGLTLVFGIMNFVNLAHGSLYMLGAFLAAITLERAHSFVLAIAAGTLGLFAVGALLDRLGLSIVHRRPPLDQVLATFALTLIANEAVRWIWGNIPLYMDAPALLNRPIEVLGFNYSAYRGLIIAVGMAVAALLHLLIDRTRIGMLIRAGACNRDMAACLGVNIGALTTFIFALGAALAGLAGALAGPILSIESGMGEPALIETLVVIVIGGIGSIRGAFYGALIVGIVDTLFRGVAPVVMNKALDPGWASAAGPTLASIAVYLFMALVLAIKPEGLFPVRRA